MRILKLRFQNLNSLVGEWQIDFTHPAYADEGIFAITGATGAGKSTILDAICLALYGATPRLGDITQSKNDLMSRQTGECLSEVIFSTNGKTYRCTWGQKRARKAPDGKLQSPKHEIAEYFDDDNGKLLEEKASRTKAFVENVTGMDFQRFTRAMLLAQGSFSAFLQASSDERSPILEQITGTEIYSEISKKVHEFNRQAEIDLKALTDKLSGMVVLTKAEEQGLHEEKAVLLGKISEQKTTIERLEQDKTWRNELTACQQQVVQLTNEQQAIEQQLHDFAPQQSRLHKALKALQLVGDVNQLNFLHTQQQKQYQTLEQFKQQLPSIEQALQTAEQQLSHTQIELQNSEIAWQNAQPIFQQVRELDSNINQQQAQWQQASEQCQYLQQQHEQKTADLAKQQATLQRLQHEQHTCQTAQQQIPHPEQLPQTLVTLDNLQQTLSEINQQYSSLQQEQRQLEQADHASQSQHTQLTTQLQALDKQLAEQQQSLKRLDAQLAELTNGKTIAELREQLDNARQSQTLIATAHTSVQEWQQNLATLTQLATQQTTLATNLAQLNSDLASNEREQQQAKEIFAHASEKLRLLIEIESLTEKRNRLKNSEPCPLCGATSHPYATHEPPVPNDSEQQVKQSEQRLQQLTAQHQELLLQKNSQQHQQLNLQQQHQQLTERNSLLANQLTTWLNSIKPLRQAFATLQHVDSNNLKIFAEHLTEFSNQQSEQLSQLQHRLVTVEQVQQQHHREQQRFNELSHQHNDVQYQQSLLQTNIQHRQTRLTEIQQNIANLSDKQTQLNQRLEQLWSPFSAIQTGDSLAERITTLQKLIQQYQQLSQQLSQLTEQINQQQTIIATLTADKQHLSQSLSDYQHKQQQLGDTLQNLTNKRQVLFGEKTVQIEEQRLAIAKQQAFDQLRATEQALQHHRHQQQTTQRQIEQTTISLAELGEQHRQSQQTVNERLTALGFADLADYHAHSLPDSEREALQQQADTLNQRQQHNISLLNQANAKQQHLLANPRTELSISQLNSLLTEHYQAVSEQEQSLGGIKQRLTNNEKLKVNQSALLKDLEQQRQIAKEWKDLHDLIGSGDGKKFRNFAQGLTFNIMISHANEQLKRMSDRYLLLADKEQPLMLNVMDIYQGNEIRTSKNLSGGESFIISLALALGLSNMASHRMQVDSLFLDEGFGTLDEEALDVALNTLTSLQQSGKLIGVISHIQALKDRISRQIQVVPMTGGVSKIEGAGVKKLA